MSILDNLTGAVEGALFRTGETVAQNALGGVLQNTGGLQGILDQLHAGGLSELVSSWTGAGAGQPISADQLKSVLSEQHVQEIASQLGLSPDKALAALAEHLPSLASAAQAQA